ncbi:hypothetical protein RFI_12455, partial [Reticulomyxa filosa]
MYSATIFFIIWTCVIEFVCLPMVCYRTYRLWRFRSTIFLKKRYYPILQMVYIILIIDLGSTSLLYFSSEVIPMPPIWAFLLGIIFYPICDLSTNACMYVLLLRYWMVCFDLNYALFQLDNQWKSGINKKYLEKESEKKMWYHRHRHTFGNYSWMKRFTAVVYVVLATASAFLSVGRVAENHGRLHTNFLENISTIFQYVHTVLIMVVCFTIYSLSPRFQARYDVFLKNLGRGENVAKKKKKNKLDYN